MRVLRVQPAFDVGRRPDSISCCCGKHGDAKHVAVCVAV